MAMIRLFTGNYWPYCKDAERLIREENLDIEILDIAEDKNYIKELVELGGKRQIPCLDIRGKALYESRAIMQWLEENIDSLRKK